MTTLVVILLAIIFISAVVSAVMYARQQAAQHRAAKIKALLQRRQDYENALALLLRIDDRADIAMVMTGALMEMQKELVSLGLADALQQLDTLKGQLTALEEGRIRPANERVMRSDGEMNAALEGLRTLGNKLLRLKLRGRLPAETYQQQLDHLEHLKLTVQVQSHEYHAEQLLQADKRREAIAHLRKARDIYKRSSLPVEVKNEAVRRLSDMMKAAESATNSGSGGANRQDDDEELDIV
ncbi:MAG: hypothetical protein CME36_19420 [unclassified Hahellaceae]|nr:hypothetical protein [Hahellaceae bacterium]|tara:strand:+ start:32051 stop:32770 length:720 start_codon:yes stop_codon:yes gene_type:complete